MIENIDVMEINVKDFDKDIIDIVYNLKNVKEGCVFVCIKGFKIDGYEYIDEVIKNGVCLVVVDEFFDIFKIEGKVDYIKILNICKVFVVMFVNFFGYLLKDFLFIGVIGINGKILIMFMIKFIFEVNL